MWQMATAKASQHQLDDGTPAHSFHTLLAHLATLTRDDIVFADPAGVHIQKLTSPTPPNVEPSSSSRR